jgi:hypothetical protein
MLGRIAKTRPDVGRLKLECMKNVRAGAGETELLVDYTKEKRDTKTVTFRVDLPQESTVLFVPTVLSW